MDPFAMEILLFSVILKPDDTPQNKQTSLGCGDFDKNKDAEPWFD